MRRWATGSWSSPRRRLPLGSNIPVPVGFQVLVGVGSLVVLFVAAILLAIFLVLELEEKGRRLSANVVPYEIAIDEAALAAKGAANDSRGFLISGDALYMAEFERRVNEARVAFTAASRHASSAEDVAGTATTQAQFMRWVRAVRGEFDTFISGNRQKAVAASLGPDRTIRKRYEASLALADRRAHEAIRTEENSEAGASRRAVTLLLGALLVSLALGLAVAIWVVRRILKPVYAVLQLITEIEGSSAELTEGGEAREAS